MGTVDLDIQRAGTLTGAGKQGRLIGAAMVQVRALGFQYVRAGHVFAAACCYR